MAVIETSEPSAAEQQKASYNTNIGGNLNRRAVFSVPADTAWAVIGTVLADGATPASVVSTLIPAIEALSEVTSVNGDQIWGQIPASILPVGHEAILNVRGLMTMTLGSGGDTFERTTQFMETVKPPVGKKWCVLALRVPAALDATKITALETAIEGITGVTTAEHLIDGYVSDRVSVNASLKVNANVRIEPTE